MQVQSRRSLGSKQTSAEMWVQNRRQLKRGYKTDVSWNVGTKQTEYQLKCIGTKQTVSAETEIQSRRNINWNPCHLETGALVQFSSRCYMCSWQGPQYAFHPVSPRFLQRCLSNTSSVGLIDDGPPLSFQGRSPSASSLHGSLLQAIQELSPIALS